MRKRIIDRWAEFERRAAVDPVAVLDNPAAMRELLLNYSDKVLTLEAKGRRTHVGQGGTGPISEADGSFCVMDAAKVMKIRLNDLLSWAPAEWLDLQAPRREL